MTRSKSPVPNEAPAAEPLASDATTYGKEYLGGLERGLQVLMAFNQQHRQMTVADVARAIGSPRATARRAINTLEHMGYLSGDGRLFSLTPRVLQLASAYANSNQITTLLQPTCERLCAQFDADCSAAVFDGADVVRIAHATPARSLALVPGVGFRVPAYCSALGRALLSQVAPEQVEEILRGVDLQRRTAHTLTELPDVLREVANARKNGYALVDREAEDGFRSIAVPVRNARGNTVAALNLGVRVETATAARMKQEFLPQLLAAASALGQQLL
jgi:IclR family pca regulon transcriptional regulator